MLNIFDTACHMRNESRAVGHTSKLESNDHITGPTAFGTLKTLNVSLAILPKCWLKCVFSYKSNKDVQFKQLVGHLKSAGGPRGACGFDNSEAMNYAVVSNADFFIICPIENVWHVDVKRTGTDIDYQYPIRLPWPDRISNVHKYR